MISAHGNYYSQDWPELAELVPEGAVRILEVGCRTGALGARLKNGNARREVIGIESDHTAAEIAREKLDKVFVGPIERTDLFYPEGTFDCIIYPDILHRLVEPWAVLRRHWRLLAPGGLILARVPNLQHVQNLKGHTYLRPEPGNVLAEARHTALPDRSHFRDFSRDEIEQLFFETGFKVESIRPETDSVLEPLRQQPSCKSLSFGRTTIDLRGLPENQIADLFTPHFLVCARRRPEPAPLRTVSVIIPVCGQVEDTRQCLESLFAQTPELHELIIVDNGSEDTTPEYLQQVLQDWEEILDKRVQDGNAERDRGSIASSICSPGDGVVRVITNSRNIGFPAAINQGIQNATGQYLLVLNNDTVLTAGWLEGLLRSAEGAPEAGIVGPVSNCAAQPQTDPQALYGGPEELAEYAGRIRRERADQWLEVPHVSGVCMLIRREVIEEIGSFNESFGYGLFEDHEFCLRARRAGFKVYVAADTFIHHLGGRTFEVLGIDVAALGQKNEKLFEELFRRPPENTPPPEENGDPLPVDTLITGPVAVPRNGTAHATTYSSLLEALLEKGREAAREGRFDEALEALGKAVECDPENGDTFNDLGWICARKGLNEDAESNWRKALELEPTNSAAKRNLADFCLNQERFEEAISLYESLLCGPDLDVDLIDALGDAYFETRNYEAAALAYETLTKAFSNGAAENPAAVRSRQKLELSLQRRSECLTV